MTRTADRLSVANAVASASVSWARRERWRTALPAANSGSTMTGIAASTNAESLGLVTAIIATAPTNRKRLRSASEAEEPNVALSWVVSAERREAISPVFSASKKPGSSRVRWAKRSERRSATTRSPIVMTR
jgi:hypothetical protein